MVPQGGILRPQGTSLVPQGTRRTFAGSTYPAPSWVLSSGAGVTATIDLDFVNQRYFGGPPNAFLSGTLTIDATGLVIGNGVNITATSALLALLPAAGNTQIAEISAGPANGVNAGVVGYSATAAPIFLNANGIARNYLGGDSPNFLDTLNRFGSLINRKVGVTQNGTTRLVAMNGTPTASKATQQASPSGVAIGSFNGGSYLLGSLRRFTVWKSAVSASDLQTLTGPRITTTPYAGLNCIRGEYNQSCSAGANTLQYEYTQPWTMGCAVRLLATPDATGNSLATMFFTNVSAAASLFPGYECFAFPDGVPRVRIINDFATHMIEVKGSTNLIDNQWHYVFATYDGSGLAAGVKIYVDGVAESLTTVQNNLGGNSIVSGTQTFLVGNQTNRLGYYNMGFQDEFVMYNTEKSPSFVATYSTPALLPPATADAQIYYHFDELSGTSCTDSSGNGRTGTLTQSFMRVN